MRTVEQMKADLASVASNWGKPVDKTGWCPHCNEQPFNIKDGVCGWCGKDVLQA